MYPIKKSTNMHFWYPLLIRGRFDFESDFCICFIIDLLMQHEFRCVNLHGRSWRT